VLDHQGRSGLEWGEAQLVGEGNQVQGWVCAEQGVEWVQGLQSGEAVGDWALCQAAPRLA
jgi:hypothetical protein